MPVIVLLVVLAVLLVGGLTGVLVWMAGSRPGALDGQTLSDPTSSAAHEPLPAHVTPAAVDGLRFDQVPRGYRMSQVDAVLDRLRDELALRDDEINRLSVELDIARTGTGDPELGHGPVIRRADEQSLWARADREPTPARPWSADTAGGSAVTGTADGTLPDRSTPDAEVEPRDDAN